MERPSPVHGRVEGHGASVSKHTQRSLVPQAPKRTASGELLPKQVAIKPGRGYGDQPYQVLSEVKCITGYAWLLKDPVSGKTFEIYKEHCVPVREKRK